MHHVRRPPRRSFREELQFASVAVSMAPRYSSTQPTMEPETGSLSTVLRHLAHELRQPLSTIESTAFYLGMILPETESRARQQVDKLQRLVQQVNAILSDTLALSESLAPR